MDYDYFKVKRQTNAKLLAAPASTSLFKGKNAIMPFLLMANSQKVDSLSTKASTTAPTVGPIGGTWQYLENQSLAPTLSWNERTLTLTITANDTDSYLAIPVEDPEITSFTFTPAVASLFNSLTATSQTLTITEANVESPTPIATTVSIAEGKLLFTSPDPSTSPISGKMFKINSGTIVFTTA